MIIFARKFRWLLRRGAPLPIPNREVKPVCADDTAAMWESRRLPPSGRALEDVKNNRRVLLKLNF